jgi:hypothetical protein
MTSTDSPSLAPSMDGDALYDSIMSEIEPELVSANSERIAELTKDETEEERKVRAERYEKAFEVYDVKMAEYVSQAKEVSARHKRESLKALERDSRKEEEKQLEEILNSTLTA